MSFTWLNSGIDEPHCHDKHLKENKHVWKQIIRKNLFYFLNSERFSDLFFEGGGGDPWAFETKLIIVGFLNEFS